jgi:hypothetical protein
MPDRHPSRTVLAALALLLSLAALLARPAAAWDIRGDAPAEDFRDFHHRFSLAVYDYPRHGAAPLGLTGFDVYADAAVDRGFADEDFARTVIDGDMTGDALTFARVGARKGLPGGINLGLSYGRALQGDVKLLSAELQYALLKGSVLSPALSVRLTGSRTVDAGTYDLDQYGAELLFSKGFTVLTPYVGAGFVYSDGSLKRPAGGNLSDDFTQTVVYGGVTLNLLLPKITVEVEKADQVQGAVRVAIGF